MANVESEFRFVGRGRNPEQALNIAAFHALCSLQKRLRLLLSLNRYFWSGYFNIKGILLHYRYWITMAIQLYPQDSLTDFRGWVALLYNLIACVLVWAIRAVKVLIFQCFWQHWKNLWFPTFPTTFLLGYCMMGGGGVSPKPKVFNIDIPLL